MASDLSITIVEARKQWGSNTLKILRKNNFKPRVSCSVPKKELHTKQTYFPCSLIRKLFEVCFYKIIEF